jgi:hypothetical protein
MGHPSLTPRQLYDENVYFSMCVMSSVLCFLMVPMHVRISVMEYRDYDDQSTVSSS